MSTILDKNVKKNGLTVMSSFKIKLWKARTTTSFPPFPPKGNLEVRIISVPDLTQLTIGWARGGKGPWCYQIWGMSILWLRKWNILNTFCLIFMIKRSALQLLVFLLQVSQKSHSWMAQGPTWWATVHRRHSTTGCKELSCMATSTVGHQRVWFVGERTGLCR